MGCYTSQMVIIYTDGSSRGNPGPGGWGAIIISSARVLELGGCEARTTNNRMELVAAIESLKVVKEREITLYTDSEYLTKGMTEWIENWQKKGWRTAGRKPVLNQDLWQKLLSQTKDRVIHWEYVAGHTGVPLNERADTIATSFADSLESSGSRPSLYDGPKDKYL